MNCRPSDTSVHGISEARALEWVDISFSRGSSWPRDQTCVSCIGSWFLYKWAISKALFWSLCCYSFTKFCSNLCNPYELQHTRHPCPSLSPRVSPSSCLFNQCCYPAISSSATLFSYCLQSFSASGPFSISWLFTKVTKVFSFSDSTSNDCLGLISFRIDRFDLLAVQETLKSLFQHSLKASVLQFSAFFISQLSYPYLITGKTIVWTICTFATLSLFFNMLPRFVIFSSN